MDVVIAGMKTILISLYISIRALGQAMISLRDHCKKRSLAIQSTSGESATKIIETTTRNLEYYIVHEKKYFERNLLFFSLSSRSQ